MFKLAILLCASSVLARYYPCSHNSAILGFKRPIYDFSVRILDRVSYETGRHFVFSPLSTWLQLTTLAEGARGHTWKEIWNVTRHHRLLCFRRKFIDILNELDDELNLISERSSVIVVDKYLDVKDSYKQEVERSNNVRVLALNFNDPEEAADRVNEHIALDTNGVITDVLSANDFNLTVLLISDSVYYKSDWKSPFNPVYTNVEPFYSEDGVATGGVSMMNQVGYFNLTKVATVNAEVLELPCGSNDRISMLVFLPTTGSVDTLFLKLKDIRLATIYNLYKLEGVKLVNIKLPRFKINTDIDNIPELVYDMGVKSIFYPDQADLRGISKFKPHASLMVQVAEIEVIEKGVTAGATADFLITQSASEDFIANKPFVFALVDRKTDIILFAGMYSKPSLY